jgi:hypothetical protein
MSTSSSVSCLSWPKYGIAPMTNYPDFPLVASLKGLVTMVDKNVNLGQELVKCESKTRKRFGLSSQLAFFSDFFGFFDFLSIWNLGFMCYILDYEEM